MFFGTRDETVEAKIIQAHYRQALPLMFTIDAS